MRVLTPLLFAPLLTGCAVVSIEDGFVIDEPIDAVVVNLSNGEITLAGSARDQTTVEIDFGGLTFDQVGHEVVDGVLYVDFDCGITCGGELDLKVPPDAEIYVDVGSGAVTTHFDLAPPVLDVDLGAGDVDVYVPEGGYQLQLKAGAGSVETDGVWDEDGAGRLIAIHAGAGAISVTGE